MNWSREDVLFSFRRYVSEALGQPWILRFERAEIRNDERPLGLIDLGASRTTRARVSIPTGNIERTAPITVTLYPRVAPDARTGRREAEDAATLLQELIDLGLDLGNDWSGRPKAGPRRVPLYDYDDVVGAGPADPYDRVWVEDGFNVRTIQDPVDPQRWSAILEATLSWEAAGRTYAPGDEGLVVREVTGEWEYPPIPGPEPLALGRARAKAKTSLSLIAP